MTDSVSPFSSNLAPFFPAPIYSEIIRAFRAGKRREKSIESMRNKGIMTKVSFGTISFPWSSVEQILDFVLKTH